MNIPDDVEGTVFMFEIIPERLAFDGSGFCIFLG